MASTFSVRGGSDSFAGADPYSAAMAFVRGKVEVEGDLVEAVRDHLRRSSVSWAARFMNAIGALAPWRLTQLWRSRARTARDIRFHYDRSNDFYRCFLDSRLVYSCAYFLSPGQTLDEAQLAKLDLVCGKLQLARGDRLLDIGCGWGALLFHAAGKFGAHATGCTLSANQAGHVRREIQARGCAGSVDVHEADYRDLDGQYGKIASIGMFEHVGGPRLTGYFRKVRQLLAPGGLFLNHGITIPAGVPNTAGGLFVARHVFPGGRLVTLGQLASAAERAGLEIADVENLRRHYALTCREWVVRLRREEKRCLACVDAETWRTWQLYLAGSAVAFEEGGLNVHQVLMTRRGDVSPLPMVRRLIPACAEPACVK